MTARMTWHKREHGAELRAIRSLSLEERGAYETILCLLYEDWAPLIDNERRIAGELGCSLRKWRSLRQSLIEKGKIRWTEDGRLIDCDGIVDFSLRSDEPRPTIPVFLLRAIRDRDGERCVYCGDEQGPFEIDHVEPYVAGGEHSYDNLVVSCRTCNRSKGAKPLSEWMSLQ